MRKLMWFTLGFGAACAVCAYFWLTKGLFLPAAGFAIAFVVCLAGSERFGPLRYAAAVALGCALGFGWFQIFSDLCLSPAAKLDGQTAHVTAQCTGYSYRTDYGTAVEGVLYLEGKPFRAKFYVSGEIDMEPGDVLTGLFRFEVTTPDGTDDTANHQGEGIFLLAYQQEDAQLGKLAQLPRWGFPAMLRRTILERIDASFPADTAPFAKALLLGDRTDLSYEAGTDFKISGIMHVVAVSGLHVSILFSAVYILCLRRRWLVALIGIPVLVLFAAVAGFTPSITRACIMQCLMILAMLFDREYDGPTELSFACLVMLGINPLVITSISFQLSVGCMAGIFLFNKRIYEWLTAKLGCEKKDRFRKLKRWFASGVSVTLSAMTLTTPLSAYYFGAVSLVGVVTNLLTLWVISFIFCGIMVACLFPAVGTVIGWVISWPIRYVLGVSHLLASFPLAAVYTKSIYIVAWLIFCYVLLAVFWFSRTKYPGVLLCCGIIGLCLCLGLSWAEPMLDECRMTVLDVGQGQCIILQSEGKTYLVDCGGSNDEMTADTAAETLLSQGVSRLDGLIVTHFDRDHSGGVEYLLTRIPTDYLFVPDVREIPGEWKSDGGAVAVHEDLLLTFGDTKLTIFAPVVPDSGNESSLAVLFQRENCDILITGDRSDFGERMLLQNTALPKLEVLVAGHHGSKSSTCQELLDAALPDMAVISVGKNHYGHPAQEVLDRLAAIGCAVYRTDLEGDIIFRR